MLENERSDSWLRRPLNMQWYGYIWWLNDSKSFKTSKIVPIYTIKVIKPHILEFLACHPRKVWKPAQNQAYPPVCPLASGPDFSPVIVGFFVLFFERSPLSRISWKENKCKLEINFKKHEEEPLYNH